MGLLSGLGFNAEVCVSSYIRHLNVEHGRGEGESKTIMSVDKGKAEHQRV